MCLLCFRSDSETIIPRTKRFPKDNEDAISLALACGWNIVHVEDAVLHLQHPGLTSDEANPPNIFLNLEDTHPIVFLKKLALVMILLLQMFKKGILPSKQSWLSKVIFGGDLAHESNCFIHCAYTRIDKVFNGTRQQLNARMSTILSDIMTCMKQNNHKTLQGNKFWKALISMESLNIDDMLTLVMDSLSHAFDGIQCPTHFEPEASPEGKSLCEVYIRLICDDNGNLLPIFNNFTHSKFTFLPVRDLDKSTSGRFGVKSITYFLKDQNSEFAKAVLKAEADLRMFAYDTIQSKFPKELNQFVANNESLLLLRLSNSLLVAQAVHVDNLHGFPNSQFGCFIALNGDQKCHVYLDKTSEDFKFIAPAMSQGVPKIFKSVSYEHSGVSCCCTSKSDVAMTWYQDCVLQYSTGSKPKLSTNANSFVHAFAALCDSTIPCVVNCRGCRLEILITKANIENKVGEFSVCNACGQVRCIHCDKFTLRSQTNKSETVERVADYLERCQSITQTSNHFWKPICTHGFSYMRSCQSIDIIKCVVTTKQLCSYSKSAIRIMEHIDFKDDRFEQKSFADQILLLKFKCMRAFAFSLCMYALYTNEFAESVCDVFAVKKDDSSMEAQCTKIMLNSRDLEYVNRRADQFLLLLSSWLRSGHHLRCTVKKLSDSAVCACGVKCSMKPSKQYAKKFKAVEQRVTSMIESVSSL